MVSQKEQQEKIQQLQVMEHNLQNILAQKQQFQTQLFEIENALRELETASQSYKIVGGIMIATAKDQLKKDLDQKKELFDLRISSIEKQEKQFKDKSKALQEEVLALMKKNEQPGK